MLKTKKLTRFTVAVLVLVLGLLPMAVSACSSQASKKVTVVKVGITSDDPRIWDAVAKNLAKENIQLQTVRFSSVATPNKALADGEIDLNSFQHYAYFNQNKKDLNLDLTAVGETIIVPLSLFSKKIKSVDELTTGAKIAIPNDPPNTGRALNVLQNAGVIKLKEGAGATPTVKDITNNPKKIQFVTMAQAQLPRSLGDVDAAIINCGYAVTAGLDPDKDAIYKDQVDLTNPNQQPYINIFAARTKDKDNPVYKKVVEAYQSDNVAQVLKVIFKGAAIPVWTVKK